MSTKNSVLALLDADDVIAVKNSIALYDSVLDTQTHMTRNQRRDFKHDRDALYEAWRKIQAGKPFADLINAEELIEVMRARLHTVSTVYPVGHQGIITVEFFFDRDLARFFQDLGHK